MKTCCQNLAAICVAVLTLAVPLTSWAGQYSNYAKVYPPTAKPYGKSYTDWTVQWWKWALSRPFIGHPFLNPGPDTGVFDCNSATNGQSGPVWFLATSPIPTLPSNPALPPNLADLVQRSCTIPAGTSILLGVENAEFSSLEGYLTEAEQHATATLFADHVVKSSLICMIDGQMVADLDKFRFASPQFTFQAPTPWIFGETGGNGTAVADGYYVMLPPLATGHHTLSCGGRIYFSATDNPPNIDVGFGNTYHLFVQDSNKAGARPGDSVGPRAGDTSNK
jgi:hypothetical protein